MIELTEVELKKLQSVELEILGEIDRVCRKNGIKYSLTGGTLLGAVRHGGFIPWDDDADISMLREEFERFREVCKNDLDSSRFYFQNIDDTEGYRWGYGKVRRKDSLFLRENQEDMPYEQGMFVDVFPRDGIPNGRLTSKIHKFICFTVRKLLWSQVGKKTAKHNAQKVLYAIMSKLSLQTDRNLYHRLIKWSNKKRRDLVRALTFPLPHSVRGYKREWYDDYTDIVFEGRNFMVQSSYIKWLELEFGNYMDLPPVEKRKVHPVSAIKFPED